MKKRQPHFELGAWNVVCDRCGTTYKNRQLRREWTGLRVCSGPSTNDCWEPRHPQDRLRGQPDRQAPPWSRPRPPDKDVSPGSGNEISEDDVI